MKLSQFRQIIKEEVRKAILENKGNRKQRQKRLREAVQPGVTYLLGFDNSMGFDYISSDLETKPGKDPLQVGKAEIKRLRRAMEDDTWTLYKIDSNMYMGQGEEGAFIVGNTQSPKYGKIWSMIDAQIDKGIASDDTVIRMLDAMDGEGQEVTV